MNLTFTLLLLLSSLTFSHSASASDLTISFKEIPLSQKSLDEAPEFNPDPGTVIAWGQQLVALGESIYTLVQKGKPSINIASYSAVSVLPREEGTRNYVELMDLEDATDPIRKKYVMSAKNLYGMEVVKVEFLLVFQVARYNGKGRYIINAMVFPQVTLGYGFDFEADMKLTGVSNKGKKDDPLTAIILNLHYKFGSFLKEQESQNSLAISGDGKVVLN